MAPFVDVFIFLEQLLIMKEMKQGVSPSSRYPNCFSFLFLFIKPKLNGNVDQMQQYGTFTEKRPGH